MGKGHHVFGNGGRLSVPVFDYVLKIAAETQTTVRIHNILGKLISEKKSTNGHTNLEKVPDGLYFITLLGEKGHFLITKAVILAKK